MSVRDVHRGAAGAIALTALIALLGACSGESPERDVRDLGEAGEAGEVGEVRGVVAEEEATAPGLEDLPWATPLGPDVFVEPLAPRIWRHVSQRDVPGSGTVRSNGLVIATADGAVLIDTAWDDEQTARILAWVEEEIGTPRALVVTHAHDDRLGGIAEAHRRGLASYALQGTAAAAAEAGWPAFGSSVASPFDLAPLGVAGELFFPGAGHTRDNAVVWLPEPRLLVGGCLVRGAEARSLGNVAEADLASWPRTIASLRERYPHVAIVLPGHGEPDSAALLTHTAALLAEQTGEDVADAPAAPAGQ